MLSVPAIKPEIQDYRRARRLKLYQKVDFTENHQFKYEIMISFLLANTFKLCYKMVTALSSWGKSKFYKCVWEQLLKISFSLLNIRSEAVESSREKILDIAKNIFSLSFEIIHFWIYKNIMIKFFSW